MINIALLSLTVLVASFFIWILISRFRKGISHIKKTPFTNKKSKNTKQKTKITRELYNPLSNDRNKYFTIYKLSNFTQISKFNSEYYKNFTIFSKKVNNL